MTLFVPDSRREDEPAGGRPQTGRSQVSAPRSPRDHGSILPTGLSTSGVTSTHLFAGGCGDMVGFAGAGFDPQFAANHMAAAIDTVRRNFPAVRYERCDINNLDFRHIPRTRVLVGSPICKEVAPAGGNSTASQKPVTGQAPAADGRAPAPAWSRTRATAWDLIRANEVHDYDMVCGENVPDFVTRWALFEAWANVWDAMGFNGQIVSVDAAHISGPGNTAAPQHRHRVLFVFTRKGLPLPDLQVRPDCLCVECGPVQGVQVWAKRFSEPGVRKAGTYDKQYRYACPNARCGRRVEPVTLAIGDHIDLTLPGRSFGAGRRDRKKFTPYAQETRRKVAIGLQRYPGRPFLVVLRNHCTVQSLDEPIGAITAEGNHHMLVKPGPTVDDCEVQMISLRTKARAQRFPDGHVFEGTTAADLTRQVGNAVPVNVAHWLAQRVLPSLN
ncbi:DNA cytosine methyltransferase [Streptomyces clavifer]|uniref:DNA cytosine methyltransferase n=1 Tax=Streptomyces clavifer TaxID=68188 RepID=UPI00343200D2